MKSIDEYATIGAIALTLVLMIAAGWWWLPQKWHACQKLYDNKPAQILCLLDSK
jgi:hypothetical protein